MFLFVVKDTGEQADEEAHQERSGRVPSAEVYSPGSRVHHTPGTWLQSPTPKLPTPSPASKVSWRFRYADAFDRIVAIGG